MADVTKITFSGNFRNIAFVILLAFVLMTFVFFMDLIGTFLLLQIKSRQLSLINRIQEKLYELTPIHAAIAVDVKVLKQLTQAKNQIIKVIGDVAKHDLIKIHKHNIFVINENAQHDTHPLTHSKSRFLRQRQFGLLLNHTVDDSWRFIDGHLVYVCGLVSFISIFDVVNIIGLFKGLFQNLFVMSMYIV